MKLFGTDGIRGPVGGDKMNPEIAAAFGKAMVSFCRKRNFPEKIIITRDTRESGPVLEDAVVAGVISAGADAVVAGVMPTPALAYLTRGENFGAGIVISASHNPYQHNGLKPFKNDGTKFTDEEEAGIEKYILEGAPPEEKNPVPGEKKFLPEAKEKYVNFILDKFQAIGGRSGLKIVLDCANGATFEVAPAVFGKIATDPVLLCVSPDGKNINDNCGSQHVENLQKVVLEKRADVGLAFDGDGDRVIAIDEKGKALTGDHMVYVIAKMLKEKGDLKNDLAVTTVMSNLGFVSSLKQLGIRHLATGVGDRKVFFEMEEEGAVLGGEEAGHIIYSDFHPAGDGLVGGLMLVAAMDYFKKPLSDLAGEVTLYPKLLVNVPVKSKPELGAIPEIQGIIKEVEGKLGGEGRVLVRYSGTENLCRVMVEGRNGDEVKEYADKIAGVIEKCLG